MLNRRILVIDDDVAVRKLLAQHLSDWRTEVCLAGDGESGVALAKERQPDLILLDIDMPGMTGHEVCRRLKFDASTRAIPIAFLTAASSSDEKILGLDEGAIDYIVKPFDPYEVAARTRAAFRIACVLERAVSNSLTDALTGLSSRPAFEQLLSMDLARARRSAGPLACTLLEPDRLEEVAIKEGFAECDRLLCDLAKVVKDASRDEDSTFRYSDRQFAILAPNVDIKEAMKVCERLRHKILSHPTLGDQSGIPITISQGFAISRFSFGRSAVDAAESALRQAKNVGGDTIVGGTELSELRLAI